MSNEIIMKAIRERIKGIPLEKHTLVVLKGIPLSIVDENNAQISLDRVIENKVGYLMSIYGSRSYITYEEFLLLADFLVAQYKEIIILNNNIYMEQYPVEECFPEDVRNGLLSHFEESEREEDDDTFIGDIEEYTAIFEGLTEYNGYLLGAYSTTKVLSNNKVVTINLFDYHNNEIIAVQNEDAIECDITDESDYIDFVKRMFDTPDELYVRIANYTGNIKRL